MVLNISRVGDIGAIKNKGVYMDFSKISLATVVAFGCTMVGAQEIATWSGDRKAAVSFTFDDGAPSQVSDAGPTFDKYGYKATFNLVVNWNPDWNGFQKMADNGHEIASHSNTHGQNMSGEEASSKSGIASHIKQKYGIITVAYPNCNVPNASAVTQNYIIGRICNGSWQNQADIMGKDGPSDWTKASALMTGTENGGIQGNGFTDKMGQALNQGGWVAFLTHGLQGKQNGNATYSPTNLNDIENALKKAKDNDGDYWVAPMGYVAMYIKERKNSKVNKKSGDANSITFEVTHSIKDNVSAYDYPLTIKIKNDNNWTKVKATQGGAEVEANIANGNILVEAVPNAGDVVVSNGDASSTPTTPASSSSAAEEKKESSSSAADKPASSSSKKNDNPWGNFGKSSSSKAEEPVTASSSDATPASSGNDDKTAISAVEINEFPISAYVDNNGYIVVGNAQGLKITVFNSLGHVVRNTRGLGCEQKVYSGAKGMYIVRVGNQARTVNIK